MFCWLLDENPNPRAIGHTYLACPAGQLTAALLRPFRQHVDFQGKLHWGCGFTWDFCRDFQQCLRKDVMVTFVLAAMLREESHSLLQAHFPSLDLATVSPFALDQNTRALGQALGQFLPNISGLSRIANRGTVFAIHLFLQRCNEVGCPHAMHG
jgi:hypothetical protein